MAKSARVKPSIPTKKHMARLERERRQKRFILIGTLAVIVIVVGLIAYGIISEVLLQPLQPVAIVNGEKITTRDYQVMVRYSRQQLINNALNTYQFIQMFQDSPDTQATFVNQLSQIQSQLNPTVIGQSILDQMTDDVIIRQQAELMGITVSEEEVDQTFQEALGYYPDGTPTPTLTLEPIPTSTLSPRQKTLVPPTATLPATATPTVTATLAPTATPTEISTLTPTSPPSPTPTEYTFEGYQEQYQQVVDNFQETIDFNEDDLRTVIKSQLYNQKVQEAVLEELEVEAVEEQVWARHILVPTQDTADLVLFRHEGGDEFCVLAAELSIDTSNKDQCGDLGWFGRGAMVPEFEEAAFSLNIGEVSDPVETQFGWHVLQVLGHEDRYLSDFDHQSRRDQAFNDWLSDQRESSEIEIMDEWVDSIPTEPSLPIELLNFISQFQQQQLQPTLPLPVPTQPEP